MLPTEGLCPVHFERVQDLACQGSRHAPPSQIGADAEGAIPPGHPAPGQGFGEPAIRLKPRILELVQEFVHGFRRTPPLEEFPPEFATAVLPLGEEPKGPVPQLGDRRGHPSRTVQISEKPFFRRALTGTRTPSSGYPTTTRRKGRSRSGRSRISFRKRMGLGVWVRVASPA
jgi:hypothetical protein